jgi:hypothetical protein
VIRSAGKQPALFLLGDGTMLKLKAADVILWLDEVTNKELVKTIWLAAEQRLNDLRRAERFKAEEEARKKGEQT